jgi:K+-sensing histidine kinase KdpD
MRSWSVTYAFRFRSLSTVSGEWTDDLLAVVAHSLLGSAAVVVGGASTLIEHHDRLTDAQREQLLGAIKTQGEHISELLKDFIRGGSDQVRATLDMLPASPLVERIMAESDSDH